MNNNDDTYKILLDGRWALRDLTEFTRLYNQNYSFIYCLDTETNFAANKHIKEVLEEYELRSGSSYVSIYSIFRHQIPKEDRPIIRSISYASPGWLELALDPEVAGEIAQAVAIFLGSSTVVIAAYKGLSEVYSELRERRKKRKNKLIRLEKEKLIEVQKLNRELAKGLGFKSLKELDKHTKDPEESSKLLMAHYRRIKRMSKFVQNEQAFFPINKEG